MADRPRNDLTFEPALHDLLDDPVVQAMMDRDGVGRDHILDLAASVQERFAEEGDDDGTPDNASYFGDEEDDWYAH